ncbi:sensor histidine kinase [Microbacterium halophytorum]|uniref:sensor histidine kinase n=1 Tax=Microbacterium halophytorum TaxID=2067568 RepID=UPI000CFDD7FF|nr:histidine kinase [Microbacterium halophytorum]
MATLRARSETRLDGIGMLVAAALIAAVALPLTLVVLDQTPDRGISPALSAWVISLCALLHAANVLARWLPTGAFVAGSLLMLALAITHIPGLSSAAMMPSGLAYLPLVWRMAADDDRLRSRGALAVGIAGAVVITALDATRGGVRDPLLLLAESGMLVAGILAAWALGALSRTRRSAEAERLEERTRRAVADERARISRDLHDVVSHSLAVMIAQAEAARVLARGAGADEALEKVAETGRSAMQGLRGMIGVLDARPASSEAVPDVARIPELVEGARSAEHVIELEVRGRAMPIAPDAELAAYRMAQEALTNAIRHVAPPVRIDVVVAWGEDDVEVVVADDGGRGRAAPTAAEHGGTGLIAMTERIERAGGSLEIARGSGWRLRAVLPAGARA